MVSQARSGETSGAMLARPSTRIWSLSPAVAGRFEIGPGEMAQAEFDPVAGHGLARHLGVAFGLVADGGADEIAAVGVDPFRDEQVDMAEIDEAEIDRDLLAVAGPAWGFRLHDGPFLDLQHHAIPLPSCWMVYGASMMHCNMTDRAVRDQDASAFGR